MKATIFIGDAIERLRELSDESVQCVVTSPPYWGLRDYGTALWEGGDAGCDHKQGRPGAGRADGVVERAQRNRDGVGSMGGDCRKCGATRIDAQLGLEKTPEEYIGRMVEVFREVWRVLRGDGTLWLNIGDSYAAGGKGGGGSYMAERRDSAWQKRSEVNGWRSHPIGMKDKDLCGIPWMLAFALRADGWWLRQEIIWSKPNPMPETVTDRCTKAHEYLFLLTKSARYYFDQEAILEPCSPNTNPRLSQDLIHQIGSERAHAGGKTNGNMKAVGRKAATIGSGNKNNPSFTSAVCLPVTQRNKRSVWEIATQPYAGAHFATFPEKLVEPCISAGSRGSGKRCDCQELILSPLGTGESDDPTMETGRAGMNRPRRPDEGTRPITRFQQRHYAQQMKASSHRTEMATEASAAFGHYIRTDRNGARPARQDLLDRWRALGWLVDPPAECSCPIEPGDVVLDPFCGSGTTGVVALRYHRDFVGIELNPEYAEMAERRIGGEIPLFAGVEVVRPKLAVVKAS